MVRDIEIDKSKYQGKRVALAVSGGRDSMALLHSFQKNNLDFFVVNIEHGIRNITSKQDSQFVKNYCDKNGISIKCYAVNSPKHAKQFHMTLEQSARELRYQIFYKLLEDKKCDMIAFGHHKNDQAETLLMRIFRGTGLYGLKGIENKDIFQRPLLDFSREEIDAYISKNQIPFVDDETNFENDATRNFFRNEILPQIESRFPNYLDSICRLQKHASEAIELVESLTRQPIADGNAFAVTEPFPKDIIFKRECFIAINKLGVFQDIEDCHYQSLIELQNLDTASKIVLPHGVIAQRETNQIVFYIENQNFGIEEKLFDKNSLGIQNGLFFQNGKIKNALNFDLDKIPNGAVLRNRKNGDKFTKFGGGTKSLGDFLTDKKIPERTRNQLVVLAHKNEILLIGGIEISDKIKITKETKKIISVSKEK